MLAAKIKEMPVNERIILMEEIWDTLSHEQKDVESPLWHKDILDERKSMINNGEAEYISIQDLKKENI